MTITTSTRTKHSFDIGLLYQLLVDLLRHLGHLFVNYLIHHHINDHLQLNFVDLTEINFHLSFIELLDLLLVDLLHHLVDHPGHNSIHDNLQLNF